MVCCVLQRSLYLMICFFFFYYLLSFPVFLLYEEPILYFLPIIIYVEPGNESMLMNSGYLVALLHSRRIRKVFYVTILGRI